MKRLAYKNTAVPSGRSQEHIRNLLYKYGASGIQFTDQIKEKKIQMRFMYEIKEVIDDKPSAIYFVRIEAQVPYFTTGNISAAEAKRRDQNLRAAWRAIYWALKSRMESIDYGIETFEQAFLAHFEAGVDAHGRSLTVGEHLIPRLRAGQIALPAPDHGKEKG